MQNYIVKATKVTGAGHTRQQLGEIIPIATPLSLHVFPSHHCNLRCGYCIHSLSSEKLKRRNFKKIAMEFSIFKKLVKDATRFQEKLKVLVFAGWGEPLINSNIVKMVSYAKDMDIAERIEIVSNGVLLTKSLSENLIKAGLDRIRISIQGLNSLRYKEISGITVDVEKLTENIKYFYDIAKNTKVYIKIIDSEVQCREKREKFYYMFDKICHEIAIEQIIPVQKGINYSKFGSTLSMRHCGGEAKPVLVCPFPFYMMVVHPDGSVSPCCDTRPPCKIGNLSEMSIVDIWNGESLRKFRLSHLSGQRGNSEMCKKCFRPQYDIQKGDNLDLYRMELIDKYHE